MTAFDYANALGAVLDANSVRALSRLHGRLVKKHEGDSDLASVLKMIELKRQRLLSEN
jgi:hypothetical protein